MIDLKPNTILEIENRKSVRSYLDREIPDAVKREILNACLQAPSAGNMCLYSIIEITDQDRKAQLSILCDNQPFIKESKMTLVFVADATRIYHLYQQLGKPLKPGIADYYLGTCDALIAAQNAVVAAEAYGIGSCYIGDIVENYEKIKALLNLPAAVVPVCLLVFGYPTEQQKNRRKPKRFEIEDIVHQNTYHEYSDEKLFDMIVRKMKKENPEADEKTIREKASSYIRRLYDNKQNTPFFKEMIRSLELIFNEYR